MGDFQILISFRSCRSCWGPVYVEVTGMKRKHWPNKNGKSKLGIPKSPSEVQLKSCGTRAQAGDISIFGQPQYPEFLPRILQKE